MSKPRRTADGAALKYSCAVFLPSEIEGAMKLFKRARQRFGRVVSCGTEAHENCFWVRIQR